jgi:acetyl esterase/lipase
VYKQVGETQLNLWVLRGEAASSPAIVFFFGGGWSAGTPEQFLPQARYLAARGMTAVVADYRVAARQQVRDAPREREGSPISCSPAGKALSTMG